MLDGETLEVGHACHRAIGLHQFGNDARGKEAREDCKVDSGLRLTGSCQDTALGCAERKRVTGH